MIKSLQLYLKKGIGKANLLFKYKEKYKNFSVLSIYKHNPI